jgi:DNA-binding NtrC family response regulator
LATEEQACPGNVRQLQHLIERLVILAPAGRIDGEAVGEALAESAGEDVAATESLKDTEREQILKVL